jgi:four helix bundle protein
MSKIEDLEAWKLARSLTGLVYRVSGRGEFARDFALRDQIRRAAVSIVSNIAEGFERDGDKEFTQFLFMAKGSCGEVRTQLYIAMDCAYLTRDQFSELCDKALEVSRVIAGLINYLKHSQLSGKKYKVLS